MPEPSNTSPYRLLVEGPDDKWSIINLLKRHAYDWDDTSYIRPFVDATGGIDQLLRRLQAAAKSCDRLGIVVDADLAPSDRWQSIRSHFSGDLQLPEKPARAGTIIERPRIPGTGVARLGVWLMPDNEAPGILEDFLATLVPTGDKCWQHAAESTRMAREQFDAPLKEKDRAKGTIHAWLAWREEAGQPFGQALTARALSHDTPEALRLVTWFRRLFQD